MMNFLLYTNKTLTISYRDFGVVTREFGRRVLAFRRNIPHPSPW